MKMDLVYVSPEAEVVKLNFESAILDVSSVEGGGTIGGNGDEPDE